MPNLALNPVRVVSRRTMRLVAAWVALQGTIAVAANSDSLRIEHAGVTALNEAIVSAEVQGVLAEVLVREGQQVGNNTVLATVNSSIPRLNVGRAEVELRRAQELASDESDVRVAETELELAMADLRRHRESNQQIPNSVTEARLEQLRLIEARQRFALDRARRKRSLAQISVDAAAVELQRAREELARYQMRSPQSGVIVELLKRRGEWVQLGTPVARVVEPQRLRVEAFVEKTKLVPGLTGRSVVFSPAKAADATGYQGHITFVSPEANPVDAKVRVVAEIDSPQRRLRIGSVGTLIIQLSGNRPAR